MYTVQYTTYVYIIYYDLNTKNIHLNNKCSFRVFTQWGNVLSNIVCLYMFIFSWYISHQQYVYM